MSRLYTSWKEASSLSQKLGVSLFMQIFWLQCCADAELMRFLNCSSHINYFDMVVDMHEIPEERIDREIASFCMEDEHFVESIHSQPPPFSDSMLIGQCCDAVRHDRPQADSQLSTQTSQSGILNEANIIQPTFGSSGIKLLSAFKSAAGESQWRMASKDRYEVNAWVHSRRQFVRGSLAYQKRDEISFMGRWTTCRGFAEVLPSFDCLRKEPSTLLHVSLAYILTCAVLHAGHEECNMSVYAIPKKHNSNK
jgi:hypothetical protein